MIGSPPTPPLLTLSFLQRADCHVFLQPIDLRHMEQTASRASSQSSDSPSTRTDTPRSTEVVDISSPAICVICLDLLSTPPNDHASDTGAQGTEASHAGTATALPCAHSAFHLPCLGLWLQRSPSCPLCKSQVLSVRHDPFPRGAPPEIFHLPHDEARLPGQTPPATRRRPRPVKSATGPDPILSFRRQLYDRGIYSSYLGRGVSRDARSRSHSRSSRAPIRPHITPASLVATTPDGAKLRHLAATWVRRELQLFPFLQPTSIPPPRPPRGCRATTAAFLLPFVLATAARVDLAGAAGQAEVLLGEYLGRGNARLLWHELLAFLRSGVPTLAVWDGGVQYWFEEEGEVRNGRGELIGSIGPAGGRA